MRGRLAGLLALLALALSAPAVQASSIVPPPPPNCAWCDGPPPPPAVVPTVAPTDVAPISLISVKLSPTHLQHGQSTTLRISADAQDDVTIVVQYRDLKAKTYHTQIGDSKSLSRSWKVPEDAGVGKSQIKVTVDDPNGSYSTTINFEVVK